MAIYKIVLFVLSNSIIICQALSFKAVLVLNGLTSNDIPDNSPTYESIIGYIPTLSLKKELSTHKLIDVEWAYHLKRHCKGGLLFNYNENNHRLWIRYSSNKIEARLGIQKNDMMEDRPIEELYSATIEGSAVLDGRDHWIMVSEAKVKGLSYPKRKSWVDKEYLLPKKEELYAKSGKLLKTALLGGIKKIEGRWFPSKFIYKDELKRNSKGTEWIIDNIQFNKKIPDSRFSKALLRK